MRNGSHGCTWIGRLRDAVEDWRRVNGWSRETAAMQIVEAHERIGGALVTGIVFDPQTRDAFERAKVNADRIFRWLDDATKDTNHLPANFVPSILAALPMDRRLVLANDLVAGVGLTCRARVVERGDADSTVMLFKGVVGSSAQASGAFADLLDGVDPGELERAHARLSESRRQTDAALALVEAKIAGNKQ